MEGGVGLRFREGADAREYIQYSFAFFLGRPPSPHLSDSSARAPRYLRARVGAARGVSPFDGPTQT